MGRIPESLLRRVPGHHGCAEQQPKLVQDKEPQAVRGGGFHSRPSNSDKSSRDRDERIQYLPTAAHTINPSKLAFPHAATAAKSDLIP